MSRMTYEDMIRAETETLVCRVWRTVSGDLPASYTTRNVKTAALNILENWDPDMTKMAEAIASLDGVSAVEIIYRDTGDGVCVYKDWP